MLILTLLFHQRLPTVNIINNSEMLFNKSHTLFLLYSKNEKVTRDLHLLDFLSTFSDIHHISKKTNTVADSCHPLKKFVYFINYFARLRTHLST